MANNRIILYLAALLIALCGCKEPKYSHAAPASELTVETVSSADHDDAVMPVEAVEQKIPATPENNPGSESSETSIEADQVPDESAAEPEISESDNESQKDKIEVTEDPAIAEKDETTTEPADAEELDQDKIKKIETDGTEDGVSEKKVPKATDEFYTKYGQVLAEYVDKDGNVNYARLRRKRGELFAAVKALDDIEPKVFMAFDKKEKMAFWLNAHNLLTLKMIIDNYPIQPRMFMILYPDNSIMQIPGGREKTIFKVIGFEYTLKEIEREQLLKKYEDPRLCFALTYASHGSAFLRNEVYVPDKLDEQLDDQTRRFINNEKGVKIDKDAGIVYLSDIFNWYKKELTESKYGQIKKFRKYKPHVRSGLNMILDYIQTDNAEYIESQNYTVKFMVFNWRLNEQPEEK